MKFLVLVLSAFLSLPLLLWTNPTLLTWEVKYDNQQFQQQFGKWAVICGASKGIGLEWAFALAERGLNVVLLSRKENELLIAKERLLTMYSHLQVKMFVIDLGNVEEWRKIASELASSLEVGFVVYNAAYSPIGLFTDFSLNAHEHSLNVNVRSALTAASIFSKPMVERRRGAIVLMSSAEGEACSPFISNYAATKSWTTLFAEGLWYELSPLGIEVIGVIAGLTNTESIDMVMDPNKRKELRFLESQPKDVVIEAIAALGRGNPTVITGLGTKLVTWIRWFLPNKISCYLHSSFQLYLKPESELKIIAEHTGPKVAQI